MQRKVETEVETMNGGWMPRNKQHRMAGHCKGVKGSAAAEATTIDARRPGVTTPPSQVFYEQEIDVAMGPGAVSCIEQ